MDRITFISLEGCINGIAQRLPADRIDFLQHPAYQFITQLTDDAKAKLYQKFQYSEAARILHAAVINYGEENHFPRMMMMHGRTNQPIFGLAAFEKETVIPTLLFASEFFNKYLKAAIERKEYQPAIDNGFAQYEIYKVRVGFNLPEIEQFVSRIHPELLPTNATRTEIKAADPKRSEINILEDALSIDNLDVSTRLIRINPEGGDTLTSIVWDICYDLFETGQRVTAVPVMRELKLKAESDDPEIKGPYLIGSTAGGVNYELMDGTQKELSSKQLSDRIGNWKKTVQSS